MKDTDSFEVPVCEIHSMEVLQTLCCPMQLLVYFSEGSSKERKATYQLQPVDVVVFNVFHDVPTCHPLGHSRETSFSHVPMNPNKLQDIRVG